MLASQVPWSSTITILITISFISHELIGVDASCVNATTCMKCVETLSCIWCDGKCIHGSEPCFGLYWGSCGIPVAGVLGLCIGICCLCCCLICICWYFRRVCCRTFWNRKRQLEPEMQPLKERVTASSQRSHELGEYIRGKYGRDPSNGDIWKR